MSPYKINSRAKVTEIVFHNYPFNLDVLLDIFYATQMCMSKAKIKRVTT